MQLMKTSQKGIALIKSYEQCRLKAYKAVSSEKYWTIGYGHYGADVAKDATITQAQADAYLAKDLANVESVINAMNINFRQSQFDALASWIFNLGAGNFNSSTMKKYIVAKKSDIEITDQLVKWVNSGGVPLLGLKRRRRDEANLWHEKELYYIDDKGNIVRKKA